MRYFKHPLLILLTLLLLPLSGWAGIAMPCAQQERAVIAHQITHPGHDHATHAHQHHSVSTLQADISEHQPTNHHAGLSCNQCTHCVICHAPATLIHAVNLPIAIMATTTLSLPAYLDIDSYIPDFPDRPPRA